MPSTDDIRKNLSCGAKRAQMVTGYFARVSEHALERDAERHSPPTQRGVARRSL